MEAGNFLGDASRRRENVQERVARRQVARSKIPLVITLTLSVCLTSRACAVYVAGTHGLMGIMCMAWPAQEPRVHIVKNPLSPLSGPSLLIASKVCGILALVSLEFVLADLRVSVKCTEDEQGEAAGNGSI